MSKKVNPTKAFRILLLIKCQQEAWQSIKLDMINTKPSMIIRWCENYIEEYEHGLGMTSSKISEFMEIEGYDRTTIEQALKAKDLDILHKQLHHRSVDLCYRIKIAIDHEHYELAGLLKEVYDRECATVYAFQVLTQPDHPLDIIAHRAYWLDIINKGLPELPEDSTDITSL